MTDRQRFDRLIGPVIEHEGGYVHDPDDPGGETKYGISKRTYPGLDIASLTIDDAKGLYYRDYWLRLRCPEIDSDAIAGKLLDTAVNIGPGTAVKLLQEALCIAGERVAVDSIIGSQTIGAVNRADEAKLLAAMKGRQVAHYQALIAANPKLDKYRRGWLRRAMWGGGAA